MRRTFGADLAFGLLLIVTSPIWLAGIIIGAIGVCIAGFGHYVFSKLGRD